MKSEEGKIKEQSDKLWLLEKQKEALHMRVNGHSVEFIAETFDLEVEVVEKWIRQSLNKARRANKNLGTSIIELEVQRLDSMLTGLEYGISNGDQNSIASALKIGERRSKLLGLDKPVKIAPTTPDGEHGYQTIDPSKMSTEALNSLKNAMIPIPDSDELIRK